MENFIDNIVKCNDFECRVDVVLNMIKEEIFSLVGGIRYGYLWYFVFVSFGGLIVEFNVLEGVGKKLCDLGVIFVVIGINRGVLGVFI